MVRGAAQRPKVDTYMKITSFQILLILCCAFYLIWWYRGYRPGVPADRVQGLNGVLLLITAAHGITGIWSIIPHFLFSFHTQQGYGKSSCHSPCWVAAF